MRKKTQGFIEDTGFIACVIFGIALPILLALLIFKTTSKCKYYFNDVSIRDVVLNNVDLKIELH